jgi:hypothetical protein
MAVFPGRVVAGVACVVMAVWSGGSLRQAGELRAAVQAAPTKSAPTPLPTDATAAAETRATLDKYCVGCHNGRSRVAGLALDAIDLVHADKHAEVLEKVVRKLRTGEMPPAGMPRPDPAHYERTASALEAALDAAAAFAPNAGRPGLQRLNHTEYANAIRDLLALDAGLESMLPPADPPAHGFDNVADALGLSPLLIEQYVAAARKISHLAVGQDVAPATELYRAVGDLTQDYRLGDMPFGTRGGLSMRHNFPLDGEYEFRVRLWRTTIETIRGIEDENTVEISVDGTRIGVFNVGGTLKPEKGNIADSGLSYAADDHLQVRVPVTAGPHEVRATFLDGTGALVEDVNRPLLATLPHGNYGVVAPMAYVGRVLITGPFNARSPMDTPSRRRIFTCRPAQAAEESTCAAAILTRLARRAYRRPVTRADLAILLGFYEQGRRDAGFENGIELALRRILASPDFLFRFGPDPRTVVAGATYRITDLELASRLSFFLWSSIPDEELLSVAERGILRQPRELERQVRRMLADSRSDALTKNFAGQWLSLRTLKGATPNPRLFPDFDDNLRQGFRRETELLFESIIRENRSVVDLLDADYTFVNERLARHYGIPGIYGDHFRRIKVPSPERRGLLGHGSVLTATSYGTRTSPVTRGKWILENILGSPPPPPPPNVPDLQDNKPEQVNSMRERMAVHRKNPVCGSCHGRMDPLGLALENFDGTGRWREMDLGEGIDPVAGSLRPIEVGSPIDAEGALPNGTKFDGPTGLREALLQHPELFVKTAVEKLLTYATGRGMEYYDQPAVRAIVRGSAESRYSFNALVMGVVRSVPFQMRIAAAESVTTSATAAVSAKEGK